MTGALYRPRAAIELDIPYWGSNADNAKFEQIYPRPIEIKWTRNHHLAADELTVTIDRESGGVDPRMMKHARVSMWMWDEESSPQTDGRDEAHLRFTGIVRDAERRQTDSGWVVDLVCQDYTSMFINMKPFPTDGMPEWNFTLRTAWENICDNTGYFDPEWTNPKTGKKGGIRSSVKALRDNIRFEPPELESRTLGESTSARFLEISKPAPKRGSDAWGVWMYLCSMLGLVSFIDRNSCVVRTTNEHFKEENAPFFRYGENIEDFQDKADTDISNTGLLVKSFDPLRGVLLESRYPTPTDDRIKKTRVSVKRAAKESRDVTLNEASAQYEEFEAHWITDQEALDDFTKFAYDQRSKQELTGSFHTKEMFVSAGPGGGVLVDILDLQPGDCIYVGINDETYEAVRNLVSDEEKVDRLVQECGYTPGLARLCARNISVHALKSPIFHLETLEVHLAPETFDIEIKFHNKINLLPDNAAI